MRYSKGSLGSRAARGGRVSISLILSYVFDWLILLATVVVGRIFALLSPNKRPFALNNSQISFPSSPDTISVLLVGIVSLAAPAAIIFAMSIVLVPGPTVPKSTPKALIWRRKLWEWHTGWLGLALSHAASFLITQGMKNLFGKPRPDLLARCMPNLEQKDQFVIGGFPQIDPAFILYSAAICTNPDKHELDDGFRSFPSGHSSFSSAGLIYLSLFIASKLAITIPFLPSSGYNYDESRFSAFPSRALKEMRSSSPHSEDTIELAGTDGKIVAARNLAAAPPVYLLIFAIIPFFASIYISATRFSDFKHHGFDILFGYMIGAVTSVFAFRYYHLPISHGAGWSWGPRSRDRAFWAGVGVGNYVGHTRTSTSEQQRMIPPQPYVPAHRRNDVEPMAQVDLERDGNPFENLEAQQDDHIELLSMNSQRPQEPTDIMSNQR